MFKKSKYNIIIDELENGDILLFNSMSIAFGIMDSKTKKLYESIEELGKEEIEKLKGNINFETDRKSVV